MRLLACIILSFLALLFSPAGFSQSRFNPTIVVLSPYSTSAPEEFNSEIEKTEKQNKQIRKQREAHIKQSIQDQYLPNYKIMYGKNLDLLKYANFYSHITTFSQAHLQTKLNGVFNNLMIYVSPKKAKGDVAGLRGIAKKEKVQYVLNFPKVVSARVGTAKQSTITVQLYDHKQGKILIEGEYTGDDKNLGFANFDFRCWDDESLECTFRNALAQVLPEVVDIIVRNDPGLQREKQLAHAREELLLNEYYPRQPDQEVAQIIAAHDISVDINAYYQGFMNDSRSKLIGFFSYYGRCEDPKGHPDNKLHLGNTGADNIADNYTFMCTYMVAGLKHDGKWYTHKVYLNNSLGKNPDMEEQNRVSFTNLEEFDFFRENSTEFSPEFWNKSFFSKVEKVKVRYRGMIQVYKMQKRNERTKAGKKYYQDMIDKLYQLDIINERYLGLPAMVMTEKRKQLNESKEAFNETLSTEVLNPFFENLNNYAKIEITDLQPSYKGKNFALIYPEDKSVIICPVFLYNEAAKPFLHYFVLLPNEKQGYSIYRWNFFPPFEQLYPTMYGEAIYWQLNTITSWNFSFDFMHDKKFWKKYVLKKKGGKYLYLEEVE